MKTLIYILLVCLSSSCLAQTTLKEGRYNLDGKTFVVKNFILGDRVTIGIFVGVGKDFENKTYPPPKDRYAYPPIKRDIHFANHLHKVK